MLRLFQTGSLLLVVACGNVDFEITGGTQDQRALVRRAYDEMASSSSFQPRLKGVTLRSFDHADGRYSTVSRGIVLNDGVSDRDLFTNARHEFCHAWDLQLPFDSVDNEVWSSGSNRDRREAFATVCQGGPRSLAAATGCRGSVLSDAIAEMNGVLFDQLDAPHVPSAEAVGSVALDPGEELQQVSVYSDGTLSLRTEGRSRRLTVQGVPSDAFATLVDPERVEWRLYGHWNFQFAPLASGPLAGRVAQWAGPGERWRQAIVLHDLEVKASICAGDNDQMFVRDGVFWLAQQRGRVVSWFPMWPLEGT